MANAVFWSSLFKARVAIVFWYSSLVYYIPYKLFSVCAAVLECSWSYCEVTAMVNLLQTSKNFKSKKEEACVLIGRGGTLLHCPSDCTVVPPPIPDALFEPLLLKTFCTVVMNTILTCRRKTVKGVICVPAGSIHKTLSYRNPSLKGDKTKP